MRILPPDVLRKYVDIVSGYERFIMTLGSSATFTIMRWFDKIDVDTYELMTMGIVGGFIAANAAQAVATVKANASIGKVSE